MSTAPAFPTHDERPAPTPGRRPPAPPAPPVPQPWMLLPALAMPLAVFLLLWRARASRRRAHASKPAVDWKFASANQVHFSPRMDFHPTLNCGRRRR